MGDPRNDEEGNVEPLIVDNSVNGLRILPSYFGIRQLMDDLFIHLMTLTSCISERFTSFIEELVSQDVSGSSMGQEVPFSAYRLASHEDVKSCLASLGPREYERSDILLMNNNCWIRSSLYHGLVLPICVLKIAWKVAFRYLENTVKNLIHAQEKAKRLISRVQLTLRGSSDDIGWLQRSLDMVPVCDGTNRFIELLHSIRDGNHTLPSSFVYLLIPGLFSNHSPLYFVSTKRFFSKMGLACHIAKIHSEASVAHNAWELKQYIEELYWGSGKMVLLLGHSKGGVDAAAALSMYWSELEGKVAGLVLVQCPYGGSPIASDILREGQIADKETRKIMELLICKFIKGDLRALEDLTYDKRKEFISKHKFPDKVPLISFHTEAAITPGVLATMSHIAHAELPWLPIPNFGTENSMSVSCSRKLPVFIPIAAAMAVSALHLLLRYGEKSDGLVTRRDAEVPGSIIVRPDRKLDHAWMVYSSWKNDPCESNACEMCEALLTFLVEVGNFKQDQLLASWEDMGDVDVKEKGKV